ncbi:MAG: sugar ABC transporter permease YjfF [Fimbriimonadaceae bacterium]|nr:sugar ABC transporter permease YjfF [Fimbriimonadaceae bacterium]
MNRFLSQERLPVLITSVVAIAMFLIAGFKYDNFLTLRVFFNLFSDNAFLGIVAVGLTFVILTGGIDLSVGSMVGCSSIMLATLIRDSQVAPPLAVGIVLAFGCLIGLTQGFLIARFELQPFLVTLAGLFLCRGIALRISQQSVQIDHPLFDQWASFSIALPQKSSLSFAALLLFLVVGIGWYLSRLRPFGRAIYAIGGNRQSAELMGVPVRKTLIGAYVISGICAALGGVVFTLYTQSGNAVSGTGLELDAIAAVVIGGTLLRGGYGSVPGSLLGVCVLGIVQTAITFDGTLSSWWTKIVIGVLLLGFLLLQRWIESAALSRRALAPSGTN